MYLLIVSYLILDIKQEQRLLRSFSVYVTETFNRRYFYYLTTLNYMELKISNVNFLLIHFIFCSHLVHFLVNFFILKITTGMIQTNKSC